METKKKVGPRAGRLGAVAAVLLAASAGLAACSSAPGGQGGTSAAPQQHGYFVYWDQNEEEDYLASTTKQVGQLVPPWDPNGQMCLLPDGSGRFVVGYNPTLPSQHNPGSLKPVMQPPVGEAMWNPNGNFTGKTMYVPGPYHLPGQTVGGDVPPDASSNAFNNNGTFTGCAFDHDGNLLATDLGTAQGQFPSPDNGRLIEWFAPSYTSYCIVDGPTEGGVGPHHVDGTGGLRQPGDLTVDDQGDLLLPEAGAAQGGLPAGRVLRFDHSSFPKSAADCPDGLYPRQRLRYSVFIQGSLALLPFPLAIARDPACSCWAVDTVFGDPAIAWFDDQGHPLAAQGVVHGETLAQIGQDANGYNPFGLAFAPDGTAYFVDIHIHCKGTLIGCGPTSNGGRVMKVTFTNGQPDPPVPIASGYNFPTSVTVCVAGHGICPTPKKSATPSSARSSTG